MEKLYKITPAPGVEAPKSIHQAMKLAEKTGVLPVPAEAMCLTVAGGKIEVDHERK
jgi:hypothetical protein